jgi:hypothetical protein
MLYFTPLRGPRRHPWGTPSTHRSPHPHASGAPPEIDHSGHTSTPPPCLGYMFTIFGPRARFMLYLTPPDRLGGTPGAPTLRIGHPTPDPSGAPPRIEHMGHTSTPPPCGGYRFTILGPRARF